MVVCGRADGASASPPSRHRAGASPGLGQPHHHLAGPCLRERFEALLRTRGCDVADRVVTSTSDLAILPAERIPARGELITRRFPAGEELVSLIRAVRRDSRTPHSAMGCSTTRSQRCSRRSKWSRALDLRGDLRRTNKNHLQTLKSVRKRRPGEASVVVCIGSRYRAKHRAAYTRTRRLARLVLSAERQPGAHVRDSTHAQPPAMGLHPAATPSSAGRWTRGRSTCHLAAYGCYSR